MEGFPVDVELLSRFRSPKQQDEILRKIKRGSIDIVVGTHRLVSKDVRFRDLGLVIIDEEQRFGVAQKGKAESHVQKRRCAHSLRHTYPPHTEYGAFRYPGYVRHRGSAP